MALLNFFPLLLLPLSPLPARQPPGTTISLCAAASSARVGARGSKPREDPAEVAGGKQHFF